jgi:phage recombination protein Bet
MEMTIWSETKLPDIKQLYGEKLTEQEFSMFMNLGKALDANPFTREIFAVKYGNAPANIFCGRDFYRRKAQEQPDFNGLQSSPVYENDLFEVENGIPKHKYNLKSRGKLVAGYAVVYRKGIQYPYFIFAEFSEYYQGNKKPDGTIKKKKDQYGNWIDSKPTVWDEKPATMIQKVAEAQALRGAYQGIFKGTYDESEQWKIEEKVINPVPQEPEKTQAPEYKAMETKVSKDGQVVYASGSSEFSEYKEESKEEKQPEIKKETKKKSNVSPSVILENLDKEIYSSVMQDDALDALDKLKTRWETKRDTFMKAGVFDIGLQKIKSKVKELENEKKD